jgi:hypothetical protein
MVVYGPSEPRLASVANRVHDKIVKSHAALRSDLRSQKS